jgi:hypothetical protein
MKAGRKNSGNFTHVYLCRKPKLGGEKKLVVNSTFYLVLGAAEACINTRVRYFCPVLIKILKF